MRQVCEDRTWIIQFSWEANHCFENIVFAYQAIQSKKAKKVRVQNSCSRWHLWFYVWLFCLWWEKLCRARWWKIWSFTEMCASSCKAMRWSSWSQELSSVLWQLVHNVGSPTSPYIKRNICCWYNSIETFARLSSWCKQRSHEKWQRRYGLSL